MAGAAASVVERGDAIGAYRPISASAAAPGNWLPKIQRHREQAVAHGGGGVREQVAPAGRAGSQASKRANRRS